MSEQDHDELPPTGPYRSPGVRDEDDSQESGAWPVLEIAQGDILDLMGENMGVSRIVESDCDYRERLNAVLRDRARGR